ncbi:MAG: hypothetical protein J1E41_08065, partial [Ruminococcus sp.]|nr:hypothetical protein [Ruminococcus sp.]
MRSSNYKHLKQTPAKKSCRYAKPEKKAKKISKLGSVVVTAVVVFGAVIIPGITLIQDVNAVTIPADNAFGIDTSDVFPEVIADSECKEEKTTEATEATTEKKIVKAK